MTHEERSALLARARALEAARDNSGIVALLSDVSTEDLLGEPELGFTLAGALRRTGESARASVLAAALAGPAGRSGRSSLARRLSNLQAALHFDAGQVAAAEALWRGTAELAEHAGDALLLANACNNLGVVFTLQGRFADALATYGRAMAAAQRLGDRRGIAQAHQNLAIVYRELGLATAADDHFRHALEHARSDGSADLLGRAEEERALAILQNTGDKALAEAAATRALDRFRHAQDRTGEGEALRVLGLVALARGNSSNARDALDAALAIARETGAALLAAETTEALAAIADLDGDDAQADARRAEAEDAFHAMGAEGWGRAVRARTRVIADGSSR